MEIKLLNYSIFITESELKRINCENFQLIKTLAKEKNQVELNKEIMAFHINSIQRSTKKKITNVLYANRKAAANDIIIKFCDNIDEDLKPIYSSIIISEMEIQNTEMFIEVLSCILKKIDLKTLNYTVKRIEQLKNKVINNEELNDNDIKFNQTLTQLIYTSINKYYQGIDIESFITKLTTTYLYEKEVLVKKLK